MVARLLGVQEVVSSNLTAPTILIGIFISCRVAEIQNVNQVALECGNSPAVIFKHYRELVRPAEAKKWFRIQPDKDGKVTILPQANSPTESIQAA